MVIYYHELQILHFFKDTTRHLMDKRNSLRRIMKMTFLKLILNEDDI